MRKVISLLENSLILICHIQPKIFVCLLLSVFKSVMVPLFVFVFLPIFLSVFVLYTHMFYLYYLYYLCSGLINPHLSDSTKKFTLWITSGQPNQFSLSSFIEKINQWFLEQPDLIVKAGFRIFTMSVVNISLMTSVNGFAWFCRRYYYKSSNLFVLFLHSRPMSIIWREFLRLSGFLASNRSRVDTLTGVRCKETVMTRIIASVTIILSQRCHTPKIITQIVASKFL